MTNPHKERYTSDDTPDILWSLVKKTAGSKGIVLLEYAAIINTVLALTGAVPVYEVVNSGGYLFAALYYYALISSAASVFLLRNKSKVGWILFASLLLPSFLFSLLLFFGGWIIVLPALPFYTVVILHCSRRSILAEFSISPIVAALVILLPSLILIIAGILFLLSLGHLLHSSSQ